jgi:hypothetical protein
VGVKEKKIPIKPEIVEKIWADFDSNGVNIYRIDTIPDIFIDNQLLNPHVINKSTYAAVATSGCPQEGLEYMFMTTCRLDVNNGLYVTDLDPIVMAYNLDNKEPMPSGAVRFHGDFEGRTLETGLNESSIIFEDALQTLQNRIINIQLPFEDADGRFTNAMHYMADVYRKNYS